MWSSRALFLAIAPIAGVAALLAYTAWISRVVSNLTALGLGYSKVSPNWAFIEPLIPGVNQYALPTRMAEVARKLGGDAGMTVPLLGLATRRGCVARTSIAGRPWPRGRLPDSS